MFSKLKGVFHLCALDHGLVCKDRRDCLAKLRIKRVWLNLDRWIRFVWLGLDLGREREVPRPESDQRGGAMAGELCSSPELGDPVI